jgi:hypothetical protein
MLFKKNMLLLISNWAKTILSNLQLVKVFFAISNKSLINALKENQGSFIDIFAKFFKVVNKNKNKNGFIF